MIERKTIIGFILIAALMIAGCQSKSQGNKGVIIKFMAGGSLEEKKIYEEVIRDFEAGHPAISVKLEWYAGGQFFETLMTRIAGDAGPDIMFIYGERIHQFTGKNVLENLSPYIERERNFDLSEYYEISLHNFTENGKLYGIPMSIGVWVLAYNKKMFAEEKISYPDGNWTWEDMLRAAEKLTKRDESGRITRFGFACPSGLWKVFAYSSGKKFFNKAGTECLINDADIVKMREFYEDLSKKHHVSPTSSDEQQQQSVDLFPSGRAAMTFVGRWMVPVYNGKKDLEWDIAPIPMGKIRATTMHLMGYGIWKGSRYKNETWSFLKYLTGTEGSSRMAELGISIPARKSVASKYVKDNPIGQPEHESIFLQAFEYAVPGEQVRNLEQIEEVIKTELDLSMMDKVTVQESLAKAKKKIDAILNERE